MDEVVGLEWRKLILSVLFREKRVCFVFSRGFWLARSLPKNLSKACMLVGYRLYI